jgi:hypothetical protein
MKIEISEVFVIRTDSMTFDREPCTVGIAALEPREKPIQLNTKNRHVALLSRLFTAKMKKMIEQRVAQPRISVSSTS